MLSTRFIRGCSILLLTFILVSSTQAQWGRRRRPGAGVTGPAQTSYLGLRVGNDFKNDDLLLGAHFWLPVGRLWKFAPGFDYYLVDDATRWQFNGDLIFKPHPLRPFYFGGGLAMDYAKAERGAFETQWGGNALVGLEFSRLRVIKPFIQARWTFYEPGNFFSLVGGLNLALR